MAEHSAHNWIQGAVKHPGELRKVAKEHGETVSEYIDHPPKHLSTERKREINFAKNMRKIRNH